MPAFFYLFIFFIIIPIAVPIAKRNAYENNKSETAVKIILSVA